MTRREELALLLEAAAASAERPGRSALGLPGVSLDPRLAREIAGLLRGEPAPSVSAQRKDGWVMLEGPGSVDAS